MRGGGRGTVVQHSPLRSEEGEGLSPNLLRIREKCADSVPSWPSFAACYLRELGQSHLFESSMPEQAVRICQHLRHFEMVVILTD